MGISPASCASRWCARGPGDEHEMGEPTRSSALPTRPRLTVGISQRPGGGYVLIQSASGRELTNKGTILDAQRSGSWIQRRRTYPW